MNHLYLYLILGGAAGVLLLVLFLRRKKASLPMSVVSIPPAPPAPVSASKLPPKLVVPPDVLKQPPQVEHISKEPPVPLDKKGLL